MCISVANIYRYPVKGLSAQALTRAELAAGQGLPEDRRFAIMHGASMFNPNAPEWLPKSNFVALVRTDRLATLATEYDEATTTLTIRRNAKQVARGQIATVIGRGLIEQFLAAYLKGEIPGVPRLVEAPGIVFSDTPEKGISIINASIVLDLERVVKEAINPLRFRPNLVIKGGTAWEEVNWVGRTIQIGSTRLVITRVIKRCAAINVDPINGSHTLNLLRALERGYGHQHCGVYAQVTAGGTIKPGVLVQLTDSLS